MYGLSCFTFLQDTIEVKRYNVILKISNSETSNNINLDKIINEQVFDQIDLNVTDEYIFTVFVFNGNHKIISGNK